MQTLEKSKLSREKSPKPEGNQQGYLEARGPSLNLKMPSG